MLYDMNPFIRNVQLPPKKKKNLNLNDLTIKISFGEEFKERMENSETNDQGPTIISPCWVHLTLEKFIDINIFKN